MGLKALGLALATQPHSQRTIYRREIHHYPHHGKLRIGNRKRFAFNDFSRLPKHQMMTVHIFAST
jgi:hypothetical protein